MTPNQSIAEFITSLPPGIRSSVCALLIGYLSDYQLRPDTDLETVALQLICPDSDEVGAAILASAVLDYLFEAVWVRDDSAINAEIMIEIAEKTGNEGLRTGAMQQPLYEKYRQAARRRWAELRRTELTLGRIADYERSRYMKLFGKLEPNP